MSLILHHSDFFWADLEKQVDWYRDQADPEIADRFIDAVEATLLLLSRSPGLGRRRFASWPELHGIRSYGVQKPFHRLLIFYRTDGKALLAERLIHGARDLPNRLKTMD